MTDLEETFRTYDFKRQENLTQKFTNILATLKFFFLPAITLSFQQTVGRVAHEKFSLLSAEAL